MDGPEEIAEIAENDIDNNLPNIIKTSFRCRSKECDYASYFCIVAEDEKLPRVFKYQFPIKHQNIFYFLRGYDSVPSLGDWALEKSTAIFMNEDFQHDIFRYEDFFPLDINDDTHLYVITLFHRLLKLSAIT